MNELERQLDVIDEDENIIRQASRTEIHTQGLLHREIHVWLYTANGEIVFQKRSATKDTYPNLLDASVGGHIEIGQTPLQAGLSELQEEAGVKASEEGLRLIVRDRSKSHDPQTNMINNAIRYVYTYKIDDINSLVVEEGMADGFVAYKLSELENLTPDEKEKFIPKMLKPEQMKLYRTILSNVEG